jgi:hypothetical protein
LARFHKPLASDHKRGLRSSAALSQRSLRVHPLVTQANMLRTAAQLGLPPISRLRLSAFNSPKPPSRFDGL